MVRTEVDLPGSVLALIKVDKKQLGPFIKRSLAVSLCLCGKLFLSRCGFYTQQLNTGRLPNLLSPLIG